MAFILDTSLSDVFVMLMILPLLSASCYGLQKLVDICSSYGISQDIKFNPLKSQLITFGGCNPAQCVITISGNSIPWVPKVKYLGIIFLCNTAITDLSKVCRNFYVKFNSIMSVLRKCSNEMVALHLLKTYCLPTLMYGCKVTDNSLQLILLGIIQLSTNLFVLLERQYRPLQFFCNTLPIYWECISFLLDQRN